MNWTLEELLALPASYYHTLIKLVKEAHKDVG